MTQYYLPFSFFKLSILLCVMMLVSCDNDKPEGSGDSNLTDSTEVIDNKLPELAISSGLIGKWELLEKRIPEALPIGNVFFDFRPQGQLTISNPEDQDLKDLNTDYYLEATTLGYDGSVFDVLYFQKDSLVLKGDIDGIKEISIFRKIH